MSHNHSFLSQSSDKTINKKINIEQFTNQVLVEKIQHLLKEFNEILARFHETARNQYNLELIFDIFEAINYELQIRTDEIQALLANILNNEKNQIKNKYTQKNSLKLITSLKPRKLDELPNIIVSSNILESIESQFKNFSSDEETDLISQETIDYNQFYDWILDVDLLKNIHTKGWNVFSTNNQEKFAVNNQNTRKWEGATVAVLGLYDKGKTFILNNLTQQNLPSSKKVQTRGISFKHVKMDSGTSLILIDTAGSYAPVKIEDKMSIIEKEATETFIQDLVFEVSDYFICVVNDFTSLDQRYLDRLARNLQHSLKSFKEIIVIHNLKEVDSPDILYHVWTTQVTQIYSQGLTQKTKVAAINLFTNELEEKQVMWFKTQYTRHVCLVSDQSQLGMSMNPWVFSLVKYWLKAVFVPYNRKFSLGESVIKHCEQKLSSYFRKTISLELKEKTLVCKQGTNQSSSNGMILLSERGKSCSDIFVPSVDIIQSQQYIILIDLPGVTFDEIEVSRQNVITLIRGYRRRIVAEENDYMVRNERKHGDFEMRFKIPSEYDRKWNYLGFENGVLKLIYEKDVDEQPFIKK